jgi:hypothetical protein
LNPTPNKPGDLPLPSAALDLRTPIITSLSGPFFRIYREKHKSPMFFGKTLDYRFDSASGECGVYTVAQAWSDALRKHPVKPDGILFPSRHELSLPSCAIFETARNDLRWERWGSLDEPRLAGELSTLLAMGAMGLDP